MWHSVFRVFSFKILEINKFKYAQNIRNSKIDNPVLRKNHKFANHIKFILFPSPNLCYLMLKNWKHIFS